MSLGGTESNYSNIYKKALIEVPSKMSHRSINPEVRIKTGITNNLFRMSIGLENIEDLIEDID